MLEWNREWKKSQRREWKKERKSAPSTAEALKMTDYFQDFHTIQRQLERLKFSTSKKNYFNLFLWKDFSPIFFFSFWLEKRNFQWQIFLWHKKWVRNDNLFHVQKAQNRLINNISICHNFCWIKKKKEQRTFYPSVKSG